MSAEDIVCQCLGQDAEERFQPLRLKLKLHLCVRLMFHPDKSFVLLITESDKMKKVE